MALLALWQGRGAWVNAAALVLGEGLLLVGLLFEAFLVDETQVDLFDAVLLREGQAALVRPGRILLPEGADPVRQLGKPVGTAVYAPFSVRQILEFVVLLPFNFVPIVGTPVFLLLTGYRAGPFHHWRYFRLLGLTRQERKAVVKKRKLRYTWFGTSALILQLIPGFSSTELGPFLSSAVMLMSIVLFLMTSAVGSALWAVDLEKAKQAQQQAAAEPEYTDDPV